MSSAPNDPGQNGGSNKNNVIAGAAVVGGIAGAVLMGPVTGVVLAGGAAYAATRSDGIGDAAKSTGTAAVAVGSKAVRRIFFRCFFDAARVHAKRKA